MQTCELPLTRAQRYRAAVQALDALPREQLLLRWRRLVGGTSPIVVTYLDGTRREDWGSMVFSVANVYIGNDERALAVIESEGW